MHNLLTSTSTSFKKNLVFYWYCLLERGARRDFLCQSNQCQELTETCNVHHKWSACHNLDPGALLRYSTLLMWSLLCLAHTSRPRLLLPLNRIFFRLQSLHLLAAHHARQSPAIKPFPLRATMHPHLPAITPCPLRATMHPHLPAITPFPCALQRTLTFLQPQPARSFVPSLQLVPVLPAPSS